MCQNLLTNFNLRFNFYVQFAKMLKCLHLHHRQSTNIFQTYKPKIYHQHGNCFHSHALFTRKAPDKHIQTVLLESKRCIQSTGISSNFTAVAQERSKYEKNTLPNNARVVICGGGVMGGKC